MHYLQQQQHLLRHLQHWRQHLLVQQNSRTPCLLCLSLLQVLL
jgi:hypothetical protein